MSRSLDRRAARAYSNLPADELFELAHRYLSSFTGELEECGKLGGKLDDLFKSQKISSEQDKLADALAVLTLTTFKRFNEDAARLNIRMRQVLDLHKA